MESYNVIVLTGALLIAYGMSSGLVRYGRFELCRHRAIWNTILLVSFLIAASGGLVLAYLIDTGGTIPWYRELVWFHVEFGIALTVVGIVHAVWHARYFLRAYGLARRTVASTPRCE